MKEIDENPELKNLKLSEEDSKRIYQNILQSMEKS